MITGIHTMFYSAEADALRTFLRDKLQLPYSDVGHGWLIFDAPEVEMGVHPASDEPGGTSGTHSISFYCDDIHATVAELKERGVEFTKEITDAGYGLSTTMRVPGGFTVDRYQPRYEKDHASGA